MLKEGWLEGISQDQIMEKIGFANILVLAGSHPPIRAPLLCNMYQAGRGDRYRVITPRHMKQANCIVSSCCFILHHTAVQHTQRNVLSTSIPCMHELIDTPDYLVLCDWQGRKIIPSLRDRITNIALLESHNCEVPWSAIYRGNNFLLHHSGAQKRTNFCLGDNNFGCTIKPHKRFVLDCM